jgi:negative regulator of sigma E activity
MNTLLEQWKQDWECRRIEPLLTAYAEGLLEETQEAEVEAHLDNCLKCQEMVAESAQVGDWLRDSTLPAPEVSTDLWSRIRTEIEAEQPVAQPTPAPSRLLPVGGGFRWASFATSFATSGMVVAGVVFGVVVLTLPLLKKPDVTTTNATTTTTKGTETLAKTTRPNSNTNANAVMDAVTIEFRPPLKENTVKSVVVSVPKAEPAMPNLSDFSANTVASTQLRTKRTLRTQLPRYSRRAVDNSPVSIATVKSVRSIRSATATNVTNPKAVTPDSPMANFSETTMDSMGGSAFALKPSAGTPAAMVAVKPEAVEGVAEVKILEGRIANTGRFEVTSQPTEPMPKVILVASEVGIAPREVTPVSSVTDAAVRFQRPMLFTYSR